MSCTDWFISDIRKSIRRYDSKSVNLYNTTSLRYCFYNALRIEIGQVNPYNFDMQKRQIPAAIRTAYSCFQTKAARRPLSNSKGFGLLPKMCSPEHGKVCIGLLDTFRVTPESLTLTGDIIPP